MSNIVKKLEKELLFMTNLSNNIYTINYTR